MTSWFPEKTSESYWKTEEFRICVHLTVDHIIQLTATLSTLAKNASRFMCEISFFKFCDVNVVSRSIIPLN